MLIVGIHAVESFLDKRSVEIEEVMVLDKSLLNPRIQLLVEKSRSLGVNVTRVSNIKHDAAQGIAANVRLSWEGISWCDWITANNPNPIIMLDGVQDPHNLGACMRTACALGAGAIIMPNRRAAPLNATALKVASGAGAWLPVFAVSNILSCLKILQDIGYWAISCSEHAETEVGAIKLLDKKQLIIVGSEQNGIRSSILEQSDYKVKLPTKGPIHSLNVSVALAVALALI